MQTIIIRTTEERKKAAAAVSWHPIEKPFEVIIREYKKDRSANQNALYWQWLTIIARATGNSKEDLHEIYKGKFLATIYERDDPGGYGQAIETVRAIWRQGWKEDAEHLRKQIIALTSTANATTKQFTEYLESIEREATNLGIQLPHPDDE